MNVVWQKIMNGKKKTNNTNTQHQVYSSKGVAFSFYDGKLGKETVQDQVLAITSKNCCHARTKRPWTCRVHLHLPVTAIASATFQVHRDFSVEPSPRHRLPRAQELQSFPGILTSQ